MDEQELATTLRAAYDNAGRNEAVCQMILFGIFYTRDIQSCGHTLKHMVALSGIPLGYVSEISKGIKLSNYVAPKTELSKLCPK